MARIPSYSERMDMQRQIQEICKTKGAYAKKRFSSFDKFERYFFPRCGSMRRSVTNCIKDIKCFVAEYVKWAQDGLSSTVTTEYAVTWFKGFLNMILKAANHGIKLATTFYNKIIKKRIMKVKEDAIGFIGPVAQATSKSMVNPIDLGMAYFSHCCLAIFAGLVVTVVNLTLMSWLKYTHRVDVQLRTKPTLMDKVKSYYNKVFKDDGDFPDELLPPDPEVPNITMSFINETTNYINEIALKEDPLTLGAGVLFVIFLKASIAASFNEEMAQKTALLKSAIPSPSTLAFTTLLLYFATHGVSFLG